MNLRLLVLLAVVCVSRPDLGVCQDAARTGPPLSLADALERALTSNPAVSAARLQRPVDLASVSVAKERPNPEVQYEAAKETPRQAVGASLPIELGGKRGRRIDLARASVAVGEAGLDRVVADVRRDVRRAYFDAVAAALRLRIADDLRLLAIRARDAAATRVAAGDVPRADLTQASLALANAENDVAAAEGEAAATRAELNALLGEPPDTLYTLTDPLSATPLMPERTALEMALQSNADLLVLDRQISEQAARVELARALTVPDVTAGGAFTYDAQPEFTYGWRFSGGVTLPLFTRHQAGVGVEVASLAKLKEERQALAAQVAGAVAAAYVRAHAARSQLDRYEQTILPLAAQAEQQAQAAYSGGQTSLPALVQALLTARETRQRGLQAGVDYQVALTELDRLAGGQPR